MTRNRLALRLAGEAGQGVESSGAGLTKALARAGLHVLGSPDFMSRIRGGHNSYLIRVDEEPVQAPCDEIQLLLAFNPFAVEKHLSELTPGGGVIYDERMRIDLEALRARKVEPLPCPLAQIAEEAGGNRVMVNTAALGAAMGVTEFPLDSVFQVIRENFGRKGPAVVEANLRVAQAAATWARERYARSFPWKLAPVPGAPRRMLLHGNQAFCLGALAAGCRFISAYPMTPASSILEWLTAHHRQYGIVTKQTEDEISAVCMAVGAGYAGARAMTATSGGGFSLMVEALGLAGMTEVPVVIVDAQRAGPSTGMPTRTEQSDLLFVLHASQGDFLRIVLAPGTIADCFQAGVRAFNLAELFQTPVIVLTDLYQAFTVRSVDPAELPLDKVEIDRGKTLSRQELDALTERYARFRVTPDGISPRALPGHPKAVYTTPSDEHNEYGEFDSEDADNRVRMADKRWRKLEAARRVMAPPRRFGPEDAEVTLACFGSPLGAALEAAAQLREQGLSCNVLYFTDIWPFPESALRAVLRAKRLVVVESNQSGQFARFLRSQTGREADQSIRRYDGRPFTPGWILAAFKEVSLRARREAV